MFVSQVLGRRPSIFPLDIRRVTIQSQKYARFIYPVVHYTAFLKRDDFQFQQVSRIYRAELLTR